MSAFPEIFGALWPYALILLVGFLPSEFWRVAAWVLSRRLSEESEVFVWVRMVAAALVAAVVATLTITPPAALADTPLAGRILAVVLAIGAFFALRRRIAPAMAVGLGTIFALGFLPG